MLFKKPTEADMLAVRFDSSGISILYFSSHSSDMWPKTTIPWQFYSLGAARRCEATHGGAVFGRDVDAAGDRRHVIAWWVLGN